MEKARNLSLKIGVSTLSDVNTYYLPILIDSVVLTEELNRHTDQGRI